MDEEEALLMRENLELKAKLRRRVKQELSELKKEELKKEFSKCPICGASNFKGSIKSFLGHWFENHETKYGSYSDFRKSYVKHLSKLNKKLDKEYDESVSRKLSLELFMQALRNPAPKTRDDLAKMTMPLIKKEFEELRHSIFTQGICPICNAVLPFIDENDEPTNETIEEHMQKEHSEEWDHYLNLGRALEGNLDALSEEKEELSTDSKLVETVTEKEELSESKKKKVIGFERVEPNDPILQVFGDETTEKLSKKKKGVRRKTRAKGA